MINKLKYKSLKHLNLLILVLYSVTNSLMIFFALTYILWFKRHEHFDSLGVVIKKCITWVRHLSLKKKLFLLQKNFKYFSLKGKFIIHTYYVTYQNVN